MTRIIGKFFISIGIICLFLAASLYAYNFVEVKNSKKHTLSLLDELNTKINNELDNYYLDSKMKLIEIDGYESIGILSIPALEIELPVFNDWNYQKLKKAPCLYFGTYYDKDFVIAAHAYPHHFGRLKELQEKDLIKFKDNNGNIYYYEVVLIETLSQYATEEMITSGFDLSLYTCTLTGNNRVTVRCNKVNKN